MRIPDPDDVVLAALNALDADAYASDGIDAGTASASIAYADVVAALADAVASPPMLGLRGRVLAAAYAGRDPGASIDDGGSDDAPVAFARTVRELDAVLADLDDLDWVEAAHPTIGRVRDVVAHLLAIELYVLDQLLPPAPGADRSRPSPPGGPDVRPVPQIGHVELAHAMVVEAAGVPVDELRHRWRHAAEALSVAAEAAPDDTSVELHTLHVGIEGAMVMRTFELWAHLDDITRASGRRRPRLDARRLRAMSTALMDALPIAVAVSGHGDLHGRTRVVLTGPGGGSHDVALGVPVGAGVDATITVDVVDLCRLAARRASTAQLDIKVEGDRALADAVLASVSAFAMD